MEMEYRIPNHYTPRGTCGASHDITFAVSASLDAHAMNCAPTHHPEGYCWRIQRAMPHPPLPLHAVGAGWGEAGEAGAAQGPRTDQRPATPTPPSFPFSFTTTLPCISCSS